MIQDSLLFCVESWTYMKTVFKRLVAMWAVSIMCLNVVWAEGVQAPAATYWIYEIKTQTLLAEKNSQNPVAIASLSKMMTCLLAYEAIDQKRLTWEQNITLPEAYINPGGSNMGLAAGQRLTVRELLSGLMVVSGNDAAQLLAIVESGSEAAFVVKMNEKAKALGMENTLFLNASGLPTPIGENTSTAKDLGILAKTLTEEYGYDLLNITSQKTLPLPSLNKELATTNTLIMKKPGVDGLKTGYTNLAGYCLAATKPFGNSKSYRLMAIVMGTPDENVRDQTAADLLKWAEDNYAVKTVVDKNWSFPLGSYNGLEGRDMVGKPERTEERLVPTETVVSTELVTVMPEKLPIHKGDPLGYIKASYGNGEEIIVPLLSQSNIEDLTWQEKIRMFFESILAWFDSILPS